MEYHSDLKSIGDSNMLEGKKLALFCSKKCPGNLILKTFDLIQALRDAGITVISGFHTLMEKEALRILMRGKQPIILCPARSLENWRIPAEYKKLIEQGRLLIISPFENKQSRITAKNSEIRNELVAYLADAILIAHASPRSKTFSMSAKAIGQRKPVYTIDDPNNANLISLGAKPISINRSDDKPSGSFIDVEDFIGSVKIGA
jgi:predicted Rossmann fold nucleotide-binding protein DprA/Smf involved in DNA uptake